MNPTPDRITFAGELLRADAPARSYHARFIRAGRIVTADGSPGDVYVEPAALRDAAAAGMFDGLGAFLDHPGILDNPSVRQLAGTTEAAEYREQEAAVYGRIRLNSTPAGETAARLLDDLLTDAASGKAIPDIGLSLVFYPTWGPRADDGLRRLVAFKKVEALDIVFAPAADGRIIAALSAYAQPPTQQEEREEVNEQTTPAPAPSYENKLEALSAAGDAAALAWSAALAKQNANAMIAASGLPMPIRERLSSMQYATPEAVTDAIDNARQELATLQQLNVIHGHGWAPRGGQISGMRTGLDAITLAFEALLDGKTPADVAPLSGIREAYVALSGDYEMNGMFHPERVQFANVTSATMSNITANVLNKRIANEYAKFPQWWQPIVSEEDYATLQTIRWIRIGGTGALPTVAEGAAYTELTWDDEYESGTWVKKGGYLGITLEAMDKDDVGRIRLAPRVLAQAAWLTLSKEVSAIFTDASGLGPTLSDTGTLFNATAVSTTGGHANLSTTAALSLASWNAIRTAMRKQPEPNSSERLGGLTAPKFLLVPPDLENTALVVLGSELVPSGANNDINTASAGNSHDELLRNARSRVIVVDLWTDTNNYAAVCDPNLWPTIGVGYRFGRTPEIMSVASPTAGLMFSNDVMPVKVRFFYAVGPMDWRGMYKVNV